MLCITRGKKLKSPVSNTYNSFNTTLDSSPLPSYTMKTQKQKRSFQDNTLDSSPVQNKTRKIQAQNTTYDTLDSSPVQNKTTKIQTQNTTYFQDSLDSSSVQNKTMKTQAHNTTYFRDSGLGREEDMSRMDNSGRSHRMQDKQMKWKGQISKGELHLHMSAENNTLTINVLAGREVKLPGLGTMVHSTSSGFSECSDVTQHSSEMFVQLELCPDASDGNKRRTQSVLATSSPCFNDSFTYELSSDDLVKRLMISAWMTDATLPAKKTFLGCTSFRLRRLQDRVRRKPIHAWYHLLSEELGHHKHMKALGSPSPSLISDYDACSMISADSSMTGRTPCPNSSQHMKSLTFDKPTMDIVIPKHTQGYGFTVKSSCPVKVNRVKEGSPALKAGLCRGDTIIRVNGHSVQRSSAEAVSKLIHSFSKSVDLVLSVYRKPKPQMLPSMKENAENTPPGHHITRTRNRSRRPLYDPDMSVIHPCNGQSLTDMSLFKAELNLSDQSENALNTAAINLSVETCAGEGLDSTVGRNVTTDPHFLTPAPCKRYGVSRSPDSSKVMIRHLLTPGTKNVLEASTVTTDAHFLTPKGPSSRRKVPPGSHSVPRPHGSKNIMEASLCSTDYPFATPAAKIQHANDSSTDAETPRLADKAESGYDSRSSFHSQVHNSIAESQFSETSMFLDTTRCTDNNASAYSTDLQNFSAASSESELNDVTTDIANDGAGANSSRHNATDVSAYSTCTGNLSAMGSQSAVYTTDEDTTLYTNNNDDMSIYSASVLDLSAASSESELDVTVHNDFPLEVKRNAIIQRLRLIEEGFVQEMELGMKLWSVPLRHFLLEGHHHSMFRTIEKLVSISHFVSDKLADKPSQMGAIYYLIFDELCKSYMEYNNIQEQTMDLVDALSDKDRVHLNSRPGVPNGSLSLSNFIEGPLAHFGRITDCIQKIVSLTPDEHPDLVRLNVMAGKMMNVGNSFVWHRQQGVAKVMENLT